MSQNAFRPLRFQASLDGVRAIAMLMMLSVHCALLTPTGFWSGLINQLVSPLWFCMDIFFVLSGYLITRILLGTDGQAYQYRNYFARRALRIVPAYLVALLMIFFLVPHFVAPAEAIHPDERWYYVAYLQNWLYIDQYRLFRGADHLWSVAVEEQFYLVWALLLMVTPRRWFSALCLAAIGMAITLKFAGVLLDLPGIFLYWASPTRFDAFALGALIGWRRALGLGGLAPRVSYGIMMLALAVIALQKLFWPSWLTVSSAVLATTTAGSLFGAAWIDRLTQDQDRGLRHAWLETQFFQWLANRSYAIYLTHYPLFPVVASGMALAVPQLRPGGNVHHLVNGVLAVALSVALSELMYRYLERPALSLKRYFQERPAGAAAGLKAA